MRAPANIARHPIHPMLVAIPIGLWIFSLICDLVLAFGGTSENWAIVARYTMVGGIVGALIVWLSVIGVAMLAVSGWLGGKMVYVHGVAVETPPHPAAPPKHHLGT